MMSPQPGAEVDPPWVWLTNRIIAGLIMAVLLAAIMLGTAVFFIEAQDSGTDEEGLAEGLAMALIVLALPSWSWRSQAWPSL